MARGSPTAKVNEHMRQNARWYVLVLLLIFAVSSTGCRQAARALVSDGMEVQVGEAVASTIGNEYALLSDQDPTTIWARELVGYLAVHSTHQRNYQNFGGYKVQVIDDDRLVNAFAAPGGYLFFSTGLILAAESCAEVASVVGHELAHVTKRHGIDRIADMLALNVGAMLIGINSDILFSMATSLLQNGFSRVQEREADLAGLEIMVRAGYNPRGMIDLFSTLQEEGGSLGALQLFSSHPDSRARQKAVLSAVEQDYGREVRAMIDTRERMECRGTTESFWEAQNRLKSAKRRALH